MNTSTGKSNPSLTQQVDMPAHSDFSLTDSVSDEAWIDVIQRMDSIYSDLVKHQVELEEKHGALEDAQRFIESVLSSMSDVLVVCDTHGRIQQVNQALERLTGLAASELNGRSLATLFSADYADLVSGFAEHIRSGALMDCEIDLLDAHGNSTPLAVNCSARLDYENRLSGLVLTGRPLGELRRAYGELHQAHEELKIAQRQLIQSEKMASLGRLVAGVAHELNNPISFIFANMYALKRYEQRLHRYFTAVTRGDDQPSLEALRQELKVDRILQDIGPLIEGSLEGSERVSEIVQNLRRFATPQEQQSSDFDVVKTTRSALVWVLRAERQNPEVSVDLPDKLVLFNREGHVHQILINLLQNACDALEGRADAHITVTLSTDNGLVRIEVSDNGPGISDTDLLRVFDPFFTTKPVGKGTGLGLYISYGLASEQCNGRLLAGNQPAGGATFTLELPLEKTA